MWCDAAEFCKPSIAYPIFLGHNCFWDLNVAYRVKRRERRHMVLHYRQPLNPWQLQESLCPWLLEIKKCLNKIMSFFFSQSFGLGQIFSHARKTVLLCFCSFLYELTSYHTRLVLTFLSVLSETWRAFATEFMHFGGTLSKICWTCQINLGILILACWE